MGGGVGELERPGHVARRVDVGIDRLQILISLYPVSYTHLDVYKRQGKAHEVAPIGRLADRRHFWDTCWNLRPADIQKTELWQS